MARPNRHANSVSLFPFLAVLVCAMGALIFLLLVTTRRIRSEAIERARIVAQMPVESPQESTRQPPRVEVEVLGSGTEVPEHVVNHPVQPAGAFPVDPESSEPIPVPPIPVPDTIDRSLKWKDRRRQFERELAAVTQREFQLKQQMLQRVAMEQQQKQEAEKLAQEISLTAKAISQRESNQTLVRQAGGKLLEQIEQTREAIAAVKQAAAVGQSEFAFVPYDGASGTVRRPILIECTDEGFRFLPEDVFIPESEFTGFVADYNPLLAGADALLEFWNSNQADAGRPYVLLIVRPEGTMAYYAARKLLGRLGSDFGYELIESEAALALPEPDQEAQRKCREAVNTVLAQRDQVIASVRNQDQLPAEFGGSGRGSGRRIRLSPTGQIEIEEAADSDSGPAGSSQRFAAGGQAGATGRGTTGAVNPSGSGSGLPSIASGSGRAGSNSAAGAESIYGERPVSPLAEPGAIAQALSDGRTETGRNESGRPGISSPGSGPGTNATAGGFAGRDFGSTAGDSNDRLPRTGQPSPLELAGSGAANNFPQVQGRPQGNPSPNRLEPIDPVSGRRFGPNIDSNAAGGTAGAADETRRSGGFASGSGPVPDPRNAAQPGREDAQNRFSTEGYGTGRSPQSASAGRSGSRGTNAIESLDGQQGGTRPDLDVSDGSDSNGGLVGTPGTGSAGFTSGGGSSAAAGAPASPGSPGGLGDSPGSASPSVSLGTGSRPPARSLDSNSRFPARKLWGLSPVGGTIGFEREVRVLVDRDKVQVGRYFVRVPAAARAADLNAAVVDLIDLQARSWGNPPERFYWVPVLKFEVGPGGEPHYRQLAGAMSELGLTTERVKEQSAQPGRSVKN